MRRLSVGMSQEQRCGARIIDRVEERALSRSGAGAVRAVHRGATEVMTQAINMVSLIVHAAMSRIMMVASASPAVSCNPFRTQKV